MDRRMDRRTVAKGAGALAGAAAMGLLPGVAEAGRRGPNDPCGTESLRPLGGLLRDRRGRQPLQRRDHHQPEAERKPGPQGVERDRRRNSRLPGLKFGRTLWIASVAGGPFEYTGRPSNQAHAELNLTADEFAEVGAEIVRALDFYEVPERETARTGRGLPSEHDRGGNSHHLVSWKVEAL